MVTLLDLKFTLNQINNYKHFLFILKCIIYLDTFIFKKKTLTSRFNYTFCSKKTENKLVDFFLTEMFQIDVKCFKWTFH